MFEAPIDTGLNDRHGNPIKLGDHLKALTSASYGRGIQRGETFEIVWSCEEDGSFCGFGVDSLDYWRKTTPLTGRKAKDSEILKDE